MSDADAPARDPALPPAYAIFLPVLDQLSAPLRQLVRGQLAQFERLIGSFDEVELRAHGEFEGLGGLTTRGEIAHIMQSELLLRTEVPTEFLRRLAESETLYHEKQFSDPGLAPVYRLTISVGPGLLGHGRVLALAAIFFMARVAARREAEFHWCFVPRADGPVWFDAVSVNTIKRFLRAASHREASVDDVDAAHDLWETLVPAARSTRRRSDAARRMVDWTIGAADRLPSGASRRAVSHASRGLSFALRPPALDAPRVADIVVRRNDREIRRAAIEFPADTICLSALNMPFAPIRPMTAASAGAAARRAQPIGWEPLYFCVPHASARIVRMRDGLLILITGRRDGLRQSYFVRLEPGVRLAGVRLRLNDRLIVLLQTEKSGRETFVLTSVDLAENMARVGRRNVRTGEAVSSHLFKGQHLHAIPSLFDGKGVECYSTHRQKFALDFAEQSPAMEFRVLHGQAHGRILHANGMHHVVREAMRDETILKVRRNNNSAAVEYRHDSNAIDPKRLFGMVYSGSHFSLAYSVRSNEWMVAGHRDRTLHIAGYETVLMAKVKDDAIVATLWSDARFGGDGTLRTVAARNDDVKTRDTLLRMGDDAARIAHVQPTEQGILAVTLGDSGAPAQLLEFHRPRRDRPHECVRYDLAELAAQAIDVDPGGHMRG